MDPLSHALEDPFSGTWLVLVGPQNNRRIAAVRDGDSFSVVHLVNGAMRFATVALEPDDPVIPTSGWRPDFAGIRALKKQLLTELLAGPAGSQEFIPASWPFTTTDEAANDLQRDINAETFHQGRKASNPLRVVRQ